MATFGRKPRGSGGGAPSASSAQRGRGSDGVASSTQSSAFQRMQEELEERERFAKEFEEREERRRAGEDDGEAEKRETDSTVSVARQNPRVFLDIEVRGPELLGRSGKVEASGRLEFELFADVVPKTAENFRCLCTGERGRDLQLRDSKFHRIIPGFMAQGGDITDGDGTGGRSIYGRSFADEGFPRRHDARGVLSMANSGPNTNNSQFFILFKPAPHLDRKHVVFGRLAQTGAASSAADRLLRNIEEKGTKSGEVKGVVAIVASGEFPLAAGEDGPTQGGGRARSRSRRRPTSQSRSRSRPRRR